MMSRSPDQSSKPSPLPALQSEGGEAREAGFPVGDAPVAPDDRLRNLIGEWLNAYLGQILWSTLARVLVAPTSLTVDWWEGRRERQMSPVRTLLSVVVLGMALSWIQRLAFPGAISDVGGLLEVFVWQTAAVLSTATVLILSLTLPASLKRSRYQHAVFALYEAAFVCLMVWGIGLVLLSTAWWGVGMSAFGARLAPLILPAAAVATLGHATLHLRAAYGVSWVGAAVRVAGVGVTAVIVGTLVSGVLQVAGVADLWAPDSGGAPASFHRQ